MKAQAWNSRGGEKIRGISTIAAGNHWIFMRSLAAIAVMHRWAIASICPGKKKPGYRVSGLCAASYRDKSTMYCAREGSLWCYH